MTVSGTRMPVTVLGSWGGVLVIPRKDAPWEPGVMGFLMPVVVLGGRILPMIRVDLFWWWGTEDSGWGNDIWTIECNSIDSAVRTLESFYGVRGERLS